MDLSASDIVSHALGGDVLSREESLYLLGLDESSDEASFVIDSASRFMHSSAGGKGSIGVQIGVVTGPCYANCEFCGFAANTTDQESYVMPLSVLERYVADSLSEGRISSVSLMAIHDAHFEDVLAMVKDVRGFIPEGIELAVNMGDLSRLECIELREAGVDAAYHALRLREGIINMLEPYWRVKTMENLLSAGIKVYSGVEPLGPEHSPEEILDSFNAVRGKCTACSASARESVPGSLMESFDTLSSRRLELIRAALVFAGMDGSGNTVYGGFYGGYDKAYAELAGCPKDVNEISELGLGRTVDWARKQLFSRGYIC